MLKKGLLVGCIFLLASASGISEASHVDHFVQGKAYFYQGRVADARRELKEAQRLNPMRDEIDEHLAAETAEYLKKIKEKEERAAGLQYKVAKDYEAEGSFISAANAYQKLIKQYPDSKKVAPALEGIYRVAVLILEEGGRARLFTESNYSIARELFQFLLENIPFGEKAARVEYKIGLSHFYDGDFSEAISYYKRAVRSYPQSQYAEKALFGIAMAYLNQSVAPPRDQTMTRRAREEFKNFQQLFPDSPLQKDAKEKIALLDEQLAEHLYKIGTFYKGQGELAAAKIYYESILSGFPETGWAALSRDRLNELATKTAIR